jgi:hypothetical protein
MKNYAWQWLACEASFYAAAGMIEFVNRTGG